MEAHIVRSAGGHGHSGSFDEFFIIFNLNMIRKKLVKSYKDNIKGKVYFCNLTKFFSTCLQMRNS